MFSRNARAISGKVDLNSCQSKNCARTAGQPGECVTAKTTSREEDDGARERDGDAPAAFAAGAQTIEQARAPRPTSRPARRSPSLATAAGAA